MSDLGCVHHPNEPAPTADDFTCCFECGHVFKTKEDLVKLVLADYKEHQKVSLQYTGQALPDMTTVDPETWPMCPLCTHDF